MRYHSFVWLLCFVFSTADMTLGSWQEPTVDGPADKEIVDSLYNLSGQCKTAVDFSKLIETCQSSEGKVSDGKVAYVRNLRSWALNRRGELRWEAAIELRQLGTAEQVADAFSKCADDFSLALELDPKRWRAWLGKGIVEHERENLPDALVCFEKVCEINPEESLGHFNRAEIRYALGDYSTALVDFDWILARNAADLPAITGKGHCLARLGRFSEAIQEYNVVCKMLPESGEALRNRGEAYRDLKQYELAIQDFEAAIAKKCNQGRLCLAELLMNCEDPKWCNVARGLSLAKEAVTDLGETPETLRVLSEAYRVNQLPTEAEQTTARREALIR